MRRHLTALALAASALVLAAPSEGAGPVASRPVLRRNLPLALRARLQQLERVEPKASPTRSSADDDVTGPKRAVRTAPRTPGTTTPEEVSPDDLYLMPPPPIPPDRRPRVVPGTPMPELRRSDPSTLGKDVMAGAARAFVPGGAAAPPEDSRDLHLSDVRAATLQNHLDLRIETLRPALARERRREAESRFDPVAFATATTSRQRTTSNLQVPTTALQRVENESKTIEAGVRVPVPSGGTVTVSLPETKTDNLTQGILNPARNTQDGDLLQIAYSQPLLRSAGPFVNRAPIYSARLAEDQSEARASLAVITLLGAADQAYWRHWAAGRQVEIRRQQYELARKLYEQVVKLADAGLIAKVETIRARSGVTRRVGAVFSAETGRRNTQYELLRIMNRADLPIGGGKALISRTDPELVRYDLDPEVLIEEGMERRLDLLDAELQLAIDALNLRVAENQTLPNLNLDFSLQTGGKRRAQGLVGIDDNDTNWQVALAFEFPFGNRAARARKRQAELQRILSLRTVALRKLQIRQDVFSAVAAAELSWKLILSARQDTAAAREIFRAESLQFELGERTATEVLEAAQFLGDAQISEAIAMRDYEIAKIELARAAGMLIGYGGFEFLHTSASAAPTPGP